MCSTLTDIPPSVELLWSKPTRNTELMNTKIATSRFSFRVKSFATLSQPLQHHTNEMLDWGCPSFWRQVSYVLLKIIIYSVLKNIKIHLSAEKQKFKVAADLVLKVSSWMDYWAFHSIGFCLLGRLHLSGGKLALFLHQHSLLQPLVHPCFEVCWEMKWNQRMGVVS